MTKLFVDADIVMDLLTQREIFLKQRIITRNLKDYQEAKIPVMTAESYLKSRE